jgi:hypothetical protein
LSAYDTCAPPVLADPLGAVVINARLVMLPVEELEEEGKR